MNPGNIAPADLRILIRATTTGFGNPDSLANVNTEKLPDGAQCFVIDEQAVFELDKTSSAAGITHYIVTPGAGSGRWFRMSGSAVAKSPPVQLTYSGDNAFAADGNWGASTGNAFSLLQAGMSAGWALTALGGVLTYSGKACLALVRLIATCQVGDATAARTVFAAVSLNNDVTGAASLSGAAPSQSQTFPVASVPVQIEVERLVALVPTDTLRAKLAVAAGATSLTATALTMSVTPIG